MILVNKINGNAISKQLLKQLEQLIFQQTINQTRQQFKQPQLGIILTDTNPASQSYIMKKKQAAKTVGIKTQLFHILCDKQSELDQQLRKTIHSLNINHHYHGIIIQLPLKACISHKEQEYLDLVDPKKDVDCLTTTNIQGLNSENSYILPCTPNGILKLVEEMKINLEEKKILVIGTGKLVGGPLMKIFKNRGYDFIAVNQENSQQEIRKLAKQSDIIFSATGYPDTLRAEDIKEGAIAIDIGICKDPKNPHKIRGDISQSIKQQRCSLYTPMPGGVGPMTVYSLLYNVYKVWMLQKQNQK